MNTANTNPQSGSESSNAMANSNAEKKTSKTKKFERMEHWRAFWVKRGFTEIFCNDDLPAIAFLQESTTGMVVELIGLSGQRRKPAFWFNFRSMEQAESYLKRWQESLIRNAEAKAERRAEKAAKMAEPQTALKVGDVLVASWGYEQTNFDYYEVTRLVGKRSVELRELKQSRQLTAWLQGDCVPLKGHYTNEPPMVKRVDDNGVVKVRNWGVWARKKKSIVVGGVEIFEPDQYTAYA